MNKRQDLDRRIVGALMAGGTKTQRELAKIVGSNQTAVHHAIKRLIEQGVIECQGNGRRVNPKLRLFGAFEKFAEAVAALRCTLYLTTKEEAA
jgi:DNA-binding Lrp family transcriptional regulator